MHTGIMSTTNFTLIFPAMAEKTAQNFRGGYFLCRVLYRRKNSKIILVGRFADLLCVLRQTSKRSCTVSGLSVISKLYYLRRRTV